MIRLGQLLNVMKHYRRWYVKETVKEKNKSTGTSISVQYIAMEGQKGENWRGGGI